MSTIGGDGVIRGASRPDLASDLPARASERARLVAAALEARHGWGPRDTARLLDEVRSLPGGAQEIFLAASARGSPGSAGEWAERIARACPQDTEPKQGLATLYRALEALGSVTARAPAASADAVERARDFGPFGGGFAGIPARLTERPLAQPAAGLDPTHARSGAWLEGLPATWRTTLGRVAETAAGLASALAPIGRAEGLIASVREGLGRTGGEGVWARARRAAGEDALGRVASRFEVLRDRLHARLESSTASGRPRSGFLAVLARDVRERAAQARQEVTSARELLDQIGLDQPARLSSLGQAETQMRAADYGLEAYAVQQDLVSGARPPGEGRISAEELDRLGTGLTPPPAQGFWNIGTVGAGMEPALSSVEYCQSASKAVAGLLGESPASVRTIEGAELAAAIRDMGVPLEQVDPAQLGAALSYINTGASGAVAEFGRGAPQTVEEQRERLSLALRQFRCLAEHGPAAMDRKTAIDVMWSAARVPAHAFEKMSDAEVLACAQQVATACNTPGSHELKVGKHTLKLTIGEGGSVVSTSTKAPGLGSRLGGVVKGVLTVASFVPGPVGLVARGINAGIALVNAARHGGGLLDIVSAGASFLGAGAAAAGRLARAGSSFARVAGNVSLVADSVGGAGRGVQGIQRGGLGGVLTGAAGVAQGFAGAVGGAGAGATSSMGGLAAEVSSIARTVDRVGAGIGAAEGYIDANRAVSAAREELQQARASGNPAAIRAAEERLAEAEQAKRSAVFGGLAAVGQVAGDTRSRNSAGLPDPRAAQVPAQGRSALQVGAEIFSRGMGTARGLNDDNLLAAGAEALGGVAAARQGTAAVREEKVIGPDGLPVVLRDQDGNPLIDESGHRRYLTTNDFDALNGASSVLDGVSDWRQAAKAESQAREAVDQAEQAVAAARAFGDPEAIARAEADLRAARQGFVQAEVGRTLALDNAADRFTGAVDTFQNSRAARGYVREQREALEAEIESIKGTLAETRVEISRQLAIASDPGADPQARLLAAKRAGQLGQAMSVMGQFLALPGTDPERLREGHLALREHREFVLTAKLDTRDLVGTDSSASYPPAGTVGESRRPGAAGIAVLSRGGTLSHVADMTGIPVERLQAFNAQYGIDLADAAQLPIGQRVLVPMDEVQPRITFPELSAHEMLARQELGLPLSYRPGTEVSPAASDPAPLFPESSPSPGLFDEGRALVDGARDAYNEQLAELTRSIIDSGRGGPIAFLGTLPLYILDESVNFSAGVAGGVLNSAEGATQLVRHPVDTTLGVASLLDRAAQTTPAGRTLEFLAEAAFGKYETTDEALRAFRERMDPLSVGAAQYALVKDLTEAQFAQSLRLAREGRYSQALGVLYGENADVFVAGILGRGSRLARFGDLADDADDLSRLRALYGEGPEHNSISIVDGRRASLYGLRQHHVFGQELRSFFEERGFVGDRDIDNFCVEIERATHEAIHGGGDWRLGRKEWEGEWNRMVKATILEREELIARKLTYHEVLEVGVDLLERYELPTDFVPYRRKR